MRYEVVKIRSYVRAFCRSDQHEMCSGATTVSPTRAIVCSCPCHRHDDQPDTTLDQLQAKIHQYRRYLQAEIVAADRAAEAAFDRGSHAIARGGDSRTHDLNGVREQTRALVCLDVLRQLDRLLD